MLLREIDQEPIIGVSVDVEHWMNKPIESFLKNDKKKDIEDINVIFEFAIDVAALATQIPLSASTHSIAMRLKAKKQQQPRTLPT